MCISKEYNRYFLEDFVLNQIKEYFGYKGKVASMYNRLNRYLSKNRKSLCEDIKLLAENLASANETIKNLTKAVEKGICTDDVFNRLESLKAEKDKIEAELLQKNETKEISFTDDDVNKTLEECKRLIKQPSNPENRWFLKRIISKIVLYREEVLIVLNTGLSVNDDFNTEIRASRQEVYEYGRRIKNAS